MWPRIVYLQEILLAHVPAGLGNVAAEQLQQSTRCPSTRAEQLSSQVLQREGNPLIQRDTEPRSELALACRAWDMRVSVWSIPAPPAAEASPSCAGEEASIPGCDSRPSPSHQPRSLDGHRDKSIPALQRQAHSPKVSSPCTSDLPTLHLPERYLSSGKSHFHTFNCTGRNRPTEMTHINLADTRTTALWASQLILLCSLPEQTFIR